MSHKLYSLNNIDWNFFLILKILKNVSECMNSLDPLNQNPMT